MPERWRNAAVRTLVTAVRKAGGSVERTTKARLLISGPAGSVVIHEPSGETRRDLRRSSTERLIRERTGLTLGEVDG